jgi:hypothetical protein
VSLLERPGVAPGALEAAILAHVIERENGTIRFTHPLLSSVLYQSLCSGEARHNEDDLQDFIRIAGRLRVESQVS